MLVVRFLRPVRAHLAAPVPSPPAGIPRLVKCERFHLWMKLDSVKSQVRDAVPEFCYKTFVLRKFRQYAHKLRITGNKFAIANMMVCSAVGLKSFRPQNAYCWDDFHISSDISQKNSWWPSKYEETSRRIFALMQKLLMPIFLFFSVWTNWGKSNPYFFAAKIVAIFISTKPIPSSVYMILDQMSDQTTNQQTFLHRLRPAQTKAVQVRDCLFFCLARVETKNDSIFLIGVLGSWWFLPFSP